MDAIKYIKLYRNTQSIGAKVYCYCPIIYTYLLIIKCIYFCRDPPFVLYQVSYQYYTAIGALTVLFVGLCVSHLTGCNNGKILDKNLFTPVIHRFLKRDNKNLEANGKDIKMELK